MAVNRIGMVHLAIAEFLLDHTPPRYACIGYEVADRGPRIHLIHEYDDPPARWRTLAASDNTLSHYTIDIAGRGSAVRDVVHLLSLVGALRVSDYRPIRRHGRARRHFVHVDYLRLTPFGGWLRRRHRLIPHALRAAVQIARWRPWTGPLGMVWRLVVRPAVLLLGALGGLDVIRGWFTGLVE